MTAWQVGGYVSHKLKSEEWGSKVVTQLSEFIRSHYPDIKGYSRSSIYNMVIFYDEYSSPSFLGTVENYLNTSFVQPVAGQMPKILVLTTFSNHTEILCRCKSNEERLFYILYAHKERLAKRSNENPSIGIILCPEADRVVVEYAMSRSMSPTMVAEYKRILMPQDQMQKMLNEYCSYYLEDGKKVEKK